MRRGTVSTWLRLLIVTVAVARVAMVVAAATPTASTKRPKPPPTPPFRPIIFVKTHKTGGSTLANIVYRYGERHDLRFVLPLDDLRLGWPQEFPGKFSADGNPSPEYDLVSHHAVFNFARMRAFVPQARFITIVREPVSQFTSAWYYFKNSRMKERVVEEVARAENGTRVAYTNESLTLRSIQVAIQPIVDANRCHPLLRRRTPTFSPLSPRPCPAPHGPAPAPSPALPTFSNPALPHSPTP